MPVFDQSTKVGRKVKDPTTDKTLPSEKSLSYGAMTSTTGLAGATGIDCKLVHGDRFQAIDAKMTETIGASESTSIGTTETHNVGTTRTTTIGANDVITIGANKQVTVTGSHNLLQVGARNEVCVSPVNRVNSSPDSQGEPTNKMRIFGIDFEVKNSEQTITGQKAEVVGQAIGATLWNTEVKVINVEMKVVDFATVLGIAIEPKVSEVELEALHTFLKGAEGTVAGGHAAVAPSVNAVPHIPTAGGT